MVLRPQIIIALNEKPMKTIELVKICFPKEYTLTKENTQKYKNELKKQEKKLNKLHLKKIKKHFRNQIKKELHNICKVNMALRNLKLIKQSQSTFEKKIDDSEAIHELNYQGILNHISNNFLTYKEEPLIFSNELSDYLKKYLKIIKLDNKEYKSTESLFKPLILGLGEYFDSITHYLIGINKRNSKELSLSELFHKNDLIFLTGCYAFFKSINLSADREYARKLAWNHFTTKN